MMHDRLKKRFALPAVALLVFAAVVLFPGHLAHERFRPKVCVVGIEAEVPGFFTYNDAFNGYLNDILRAYALEKGQDAVILTYDDPHRLRRDLRRHRIDFGVVYFNPEKHASPPICSQRYAVSSRNPLPTNPTPEALADMLAGKNVYFSESARRTDFYRDMTDTLHRPFRSVGADSPEREFAVDKEILLRIEQFRDSRIKSVVRLPDTVASAVLCPDPLLDGRFQNWYERFLATENGKKIVRRYAGDNLFRQYTRTGHIRPAVGRMTSKYDDIFRSVGKKERLDWRLLSAIAFAESKYDNTAVSGKNAVGLMQVMPRIGRNYGYTSEELLNPYVNVTVAAKLLKSISRQLRLANRRDIPDNDRLSLMLAAYNGGYGHVQDARGLAREAGENPDRWEDVSFFLMKLRDPEFYQKPVVKFGSFNATETLRFVDEVLFVYDRIREFAP